MPRDLIWNGNQVTEAVKDKAADYIQKILFMMEAHAKRQMAAQSSPSSPGSFPAVVSSRFMNSLTTEMDRDNLEGRFGTNLKAPPYPVFLERGTPKMAARPWGRPTLDWIRTQVK